MIQYYYFFFLGLDGREERVENTGYVGNYKGEGTYKGQ